MTPVPIGPQRPSCPVCGKVSYSPAGIHPQCAASRADAKLRGPKPAKTATARPGSFSKRCSGCGRTVPARRMVCDCGRAFPSSARPAVNQATPGSSRS
jgi:hypothetical protein